MATTTRTTSKRYTVTCLVCYRCELLHTNSAREANREATGHGNAYGHPVTILDNRATREA